MRKFKFTDYLKEGIGDKYELIMLAAQRTEELRNGHQSSFKDSKHKNTVIAIKEIEDEFVDISELRENLLRRLQKEYKDDDLIEYCSIGEEDKYQLDILDYSTLEDISDNDLEKTLES